MTAQDFQNLHATLGVSRSELCRRLGIATNTGLAYAKGRQAIPLTVALAAAAVAQNIPPLGATEAQS